MKNLYLILLLSLLAISCKNVQKLVEQGKYDEAIDYAIKKLAGKENKETKYVQALEEAYAKITLRDIDEIDRLKSKERAALAGRIHDLYTSIMARQNRIHPFLPLVSEDFYAASFAMYNFNAEIKEYADIAAAYEYTKGAELLDKARKYNDRFLARDAYTQLHKVDHFHNDYNNISDLKNEAYTLGVTDVLVSVKNSSYTYLPYRLEDRLLSEVSYELNKKWIKYDTRPRTGITYDVELLYDLRDIDVSGDNEIISHHVDKKEVVVGVDTIKKIKIITASCGEKIEKVDIKTVDITETRKARVTEVIRSKELFLQGQLLVIDRITGDLIEREAIDVTTDFYDESSFYKGDREALCTSHVHAWEKHPQPFPSTDDMLAIAVDLTNERIYTMVDQIIR